MILKPSIFRAYDIRGEAFTEFDQQDAYSIASAFCSYIQTHNHIPTPKIFVSGDGRLSQNTLFPFVLQGIEDSGGSPSWGGSIPTPLNYFSYYEGGFDGAIQITASHNPPTQNGFKLLGKTHALCGEEIQEIYALSKEIIAPEKISVSSLKKKYQKIDFSKAYIQKLKAITPTHIPKKLIVDSGNAIPGLFYPSFLEEMGHRVKKIFCSLDTNFPNHQPDPERKENLSFLIEEIKKSQETKSPFDIGFAFDGDGDRLGVVLFDGTPLSADKIFYILSADFLSRNPGGKVVVDAMTSAVLVQQLQELNAEVVFSKTGHSYIEETMKSSGALLGGEQSGHFMFAENFYGHDDALLASFRFLTALQNNPDLLPKVTSLWPQSFEFSEKITVSDEKKFEIMDRIIADVQKNFTGTNPLDGIRIDFGGGDWLIIRASNTSPKIALRMEFKTLESLEIQKSYFLGLIEKHSKEALL